MYEIGRIKLVKRVLIGFWSICLLYVFYLQIISGKKYAKLARDQQETEAEILAQRGEIVDRNGRYIAVNHSCFSVYVLPQYLKKDKAKAAAVLAKVVGKDYKTTYRELMLNKKFFWYERQIDYNTGTRLKTAVQKAGLAGAIFVVEDKDRYYPFGDVTASALGFVGSTVPGAKKGWAGIEYQFDSLLSGRSGKIVLGRDARGNTYPNPAYPTEPAIPGCDIYLTLDLDIQQIVYEELKFSIEKYKAIFGSALVLDVETGEVLAMVDCPDFDPNQYQKFEAQRWTPFALTSEFEPGSSFKLVILATALTSNNRSQLLRERFDVSKGYITISGKKIKDTHKGKILDFNEVFIHSSNIGVSLMSQKLNALDFYLMARKLGFISPTGVELPGEANGYLDSPKKIRKALRFANNAFGQGLRVNLLQLANAYAAIADDGILLKPYLIKEIVSPAQGIIYQGDRTEIRQILDQSIVQQIKEILARVIKEGSGVKAGLDEYEVCGKTGTAQKLVNGKYSSDKSLMTFIGFFPETKPKYLIAVLVDEPKHTLETRFAGDITCPLFKNIATRIIRLKQNELKDLVNASPTFPNQTSKLEKSNDMKLSKR